MMTLAGCCTSAVAQSNQELDNLVFEPVLIERLTLGEDNIIVNELTSLPSAEHAVSASEYLVTQAIAMAREAAPDLDLDGSIEDYEKRIRDLELAGGVYESSLAQELLALGSLQQAMGEHEKALEYLDHALHINRVNLGLFNLDQETIIEEKIESHVAMGDLKEADLQQEYLFYLKRKAYGGTSVDLLPALTQYAEWNIFAFDSRISMDPTLTYAAESHIYEENSVSNSIGAEDFKTMRLVNAQNIYRTIIQILLNNFGTDDPRLLDIEKRLALTNYFFATNLDINSSAFKSGNNSQLTMASSQGYYDFSQVTSNSMGYRHGREALERRLEYMLRNEQMTPADMALARVDLGDWLMLFKKRLTSLETYEEAYQEAMAAGMDQAALDALFSPELPQTIPTFIHYRYTRASLNIPADIALDYLGWFDVRIELNRFGQPSGIDILDKSPNATDTVETRLLRQLRNATSFRPRFRDGQPVGDETIEARYYYSY